MLRLKKNIYVFTDSFKNAKTRQLFVIANYLQCPSYISLLSALSYYEVSTQIPQAIIESVCLKRSKTIASDKTFSYIKLNKKFYWGFEKKETFFIATKEKAFLDAVYLMAYGKYSLDMSAMDLDQLNKKEIQYLLEKYPSNIKKKVSEICRI